MVAIVFFDVEIHAAIALVGIAVVDDFLHQLLLFNDVSGGVGLDAGRKHIQLLHSGMVAIGVVLGYFHGLELLQSCLLFNFVVAFIGIVLQVAHIGDVAHIAHFVAQRFQIAKQHIESDGRACVPQVRVAIHGGSAHIHTHRLFVDRHKMLFSAGECIVNE